MTPTTLAETILRELPRLVFTNYGQPERFIKEADVLAVLTAAMDPAIAERAGEIVPKLQRRKRGGGFKHTVENGVNVLEHQPAPDPLTTEAADLITALLAQIAALRAELEWWKQDDRAAWDKCEERRIAQEAAEAERDALRAARDAAKITQVWMAGEPPKHIRDEWFIAKTIHGDRVVLRALPEEWGYDYKTADETYMAAKNIAAWMQMPDSGYVSYAEGGAVTAEAVARAEAAEAQNAALTARVEGLTRAVKGLVEILDQHETKGPLPDVALMLCWLAAQDVRAVMRKIGGQ